MTNYNDLCLLYYGLYLVMIVRRLACLLNYTRASNSEQPICPPTFLFLFNQEPSIFKLLCPDFKVEPWNHGGRLLRQGCRTWNIQIQIRIVFSTFSTKSEPFTRLDLYRLNWLENWKYSYLYLLYTFVWLWLEGARREGLRELGRK